MNRLYINPDAWKAPDVRNAYINERVRDGQQPPVDRYDIQVPLQPYAPDVNERRAPEGTGDPRNRNRH